MQRFIQFNDENINSFQLMQLIDLAKTLTKEKEMTVEYSPSNYLDVPENTIFVSHFWDHRSAEEEWHGLISDVYLRGEGTLNHSDVKEINRFIAFTKTLSISSFAKQLFMVIEDLRVEEIVKLKRGGTKKAFSTRRRLYRKYFESQLNVHLVKGVTTDALFNLLYLHIFAETPVADWPDIHPDVNRAKPYLTQQIERSHEVKTTAGVSSICRNVCEVLDELLRKDMLNEYFHLPEKTMKDWEEGLTFDDLKRKDPLVNDDTEKEKPDGEEEAVEEEFKSWHRETEEKGESFLQFDLEAGTKTSIQADAAREGDDQEQALGSVQGSTKKSSKNQFDQQEVERKLEEKNDGGSGQYGKDNEQAYAIFEEAGPSSADDQVHYQTYRKDITHYQKKLQKMIEKTLDHKKTLPRTHLVKGRLSKKLTPFFTDEQPRVFYKKNEESPKIDATFTLLLDCSASMYDKMDETKKGLVLFHEALKSIQVPHEITGFWEDAAKAGSSKFPSHLKTVIPYEQSIYSQNGAAIMQLQPEEDNRDGYAIRLMTERLVRRTEKQKFLLVFSDGEPAAADYSQNGILDTHEAVLSARKQGIQVMNVFLSTSEIPESQKQIIQNIYGKYSLFVQDVQELPDVLFPLLKRLLIKSI
ncbi:nitric oxide reductase activation protein NorD [Jeotgalibacillus sp. R-1-5s-1]|uniref:vWA domain-containing protein n=1 Tax=Jeotgalibacillus sp. R-1-5s-1 TaxID=2555897 RepID=UPI00106D2641|nr:VWA domain-containing protein [Jeotgalibacillus sp. R-1-5s-1]TFE03326.1 VWA domain-containing protein [Jeotgalibacillus sp. R-1-5s-1]